MPRFRVVAAWIASRASSWGTVAKRLCGARVRRTSRAVDADEQEKRATAAKRVDCGRDVDADPGPPSAMASTPSSDRDNVDASARCCDEARQVSRI